MAEFEITQMAAIEASEGTVALALGGMKLGGNPAGIAAKLTLQSAPGTLELGVSKLDGEDGWIVDSLGLIGCCPYYANGAGARYCKLKALTDEGMIAALDAAAEAATA